MLLSIFSFLYEFLCGENRRYTEYRDSIFSSVGFITLITAVVICLIFYLLFGNWKMIWFNNTHWTITIVICALIGFFIAFLSAKNTLRLIDSYVWRFAVINAIYAAIFFIIPSFLFKRFSIFSKHTPI